MPFAPPDLALRLWPRKGPPKRLEQLLVERRKETPQTAQDNLVLRRGLSFFSDVLAFRAGECVGWEPHALKDTRHLPGKDIETRSVSLELDFAERGLG